MNNTGPETDRATSSRRLLLLGILLVAFLVRLPGVFWGHDFPSGWQSHHPDETVHWVKTEPLIDPSVRPRFNHPYPPATGVHAAVPFLVWRAIQGELRDNPPPRRIAITLAGRVVSVLYGTASVYLLFLLCRSIFSDRRVPFLAAALFALGGLHVTQSHFFLADVPALFWFLLGTLLLFRYLKEPPGPAPWTLMWGGFAFGVAFGIKLVILGLPTLALVCLLRKSRLRNVALVTVFFAAGFVIVNANSYPLTEFVRTLRSGTNDPFEWSVGSNLMLYLIELPSLVSFPLVLLALAGGVVLLRRLVSGDRPELKSPVLLVLVLPLVVHALLVAVKYDHFLRHMIPFVPFLCAAAAFALVRLIDRPAVRRLRPVVLTLVFGWLLLFVFDGERVFLADPRNDAATWIHENAPQEAVVSWRRRPARLKGHARGSWFEYEKTDLLVIETIHANHYLSGMGFKNSYPRDPRRIFDAIDHGGAEGIAFLQATFRGETELREAARFREGYFMPEYVLSDALIGNRARNYIGEVVVFRREDKAED